MGAAPVCGVSMSVSVGERICGNVCVSDACACVLCMCVSTKDMCEYVCKCV